MPSMCQCVNLIDTSWHTYKRRTFKKKELYTPLGQFCLCGIKGGVNPQVRLIKGTDLSENWIMNCL